MKLIKTVDAVGHVLCHDMTRIIPGVEKGAAFRKGHIVKEEDIPVLLSMGKENLYVWEVREGILHENEGAEILCKICINEHMTRSETKEGKIEIFAETDGLLKVNTEALNQVNSLGEMMIATIHGNFPVKKGDKIAATRIIPLIIEEEKMKRAQEVAGRKPILEILPFHNPKAAIITTGSEVYSGRIKDAFGPVIREKLSEYNLEVIGQTILGDNQEKITAQILKYIGEGAQMILCTGGMSVDPDDTTPSAIKATGGEIISYGAPVLPGAMFLLAYVNGIPVMGLPGCVMYAKRTIFDLVLPRVLAGEKLTKEDLSTYGEGGLCLSCPTCHFPDCGFGK
ncbi:MAG: molybdopterin-binding protein [Lachnospiraceae bacterium]|nr:molybdopterin-binding protein [Lachnospiraceae bacterium]